MAKYFPEDLASPECDFSTKVEFPGFSFTRQLKSFKSLKKVFKAERYTSNLSNMPQSKLLSLGKAFSEIPALSIMRCKNSRCNNISTSCTHVLNSYISTIN